VSRALDEAVVPSTASGVGVARPLGYRIAAIGGTLERAPAVWLGAIVAGSTLVRGLVGARVPGPWVLPDEVVYSEIAKSVARGDRPSIRGVPEFGWGEVYPTLISPAWILFSDQFSAYHAALAINALLMSSAAIPAYLLARMFVDRRLSLVVGAMTVLVPSMAYTNLVVTENAFYPAFLLGVLLVARSLRHPTIANQALALGGLGLVALTRIQGLALAGGYLLGVAIHATTGPRAERNAYLRRFVPTVAVICVVTAAPVVASLARGEGPLAWVGARSTTFDGFQFHEVPHWLAYLVAGLVLYVAVAPAAATAVVAAIGLSRRSSEPLRLFASVTLPTLGAVLVSVSAVSASLDVDGTENLNERYVFFLVPLLFVGLALWVQEGLPRPRTWTWVVVGACCALAAVLPIQRLSYNASYQSPALFAWVTLSVSGLALAVLLGAFALCCGALWARCRADRAGRLWLVVAGTMVMAGALVLSSYSVSSSNSATAFEARAATWVDDAVPPGQPVAVLWGEKPSPAATPRRWYFWVMVTEFFNSSVDDVYRLGGSTYHEQFLPTVPVDASRGRTLRTASGHAVTAPYALVSCETRVDGRVVATAPGGWLELVRVEGPLRLAPPHHCPQPPA